MIGFILGLIGIAALVVLAFGAGAVAFALGAYEKIKKEAGELEAKAWLANMRDKNYGR
jgi:hypothetical protein